MVTYSMKVGHPQGTYLYYMLKQLSGKVPASRISQI